MKKVHVVLATVIIILALSGYAHANWVIKIGDGVGPIKLGMKYDEVLKKLGRPGDVSKGEGFITITYFRYKIAFIVGAEGKIISIGVMSARYYTMSGIKVGRYLKFLTEELGQPNSETTTPDDSKQYIWNSGMGVVTTKKGLVKAIFIFKADSEVKMF
ncbi:MAG: hypothetical protein K8T10_02380 [Candidatus Eremiobacteraeota bacterium]|nr:hypothetical protein [Candidatus Eremiobacteraeota bacterium]